MTRTAATVRAYDWDELRFSVSWKAYCFVDAGERDAWRDHTDDLELATVLDTLVDDLTRRGVRRTRASPAPSWGTC